MKIPEPIMDPATIIVESNKPRLLTSPWREAGAATPFVGGCCAIVIAPSRPHLASPFGNRQVFPDAFPWIVVNQRQIPNDGYRARPRRKDFHGGFAANAADCHQRLACKLTSRAQQLEPDNRV